MSNLEATFGRHWVLSGVQGWKTRPLEHDDIAFTRMWRNAQMSVLRQSEPITPAGQEVWWSEVYVPESSWPRPRQLLFMMLDPERRLAYGGFTNIDWNVRRAELSFMADTDLTNDLSNYEIVQRRFFAFLLDTAFGIYGFTRLFTETYEFRKRLIAILEELGFRFEGRLRRHSWDQDRIVDSVVHGALAPETKVPGWWELG